MDLARPVVGALLDLCRFRNSFPAFDGDVEMVLDDSVLRMVRRGREVSDAAATLTVDRSGGASMLDRDGSIGGGCTDDLLGAAPVYGER